MALAVLQREAAATERVLFARAAAHGVNSRTGRRVRKAMRSYLGPVFRRLLDALPLAELEWLAARATLRPEGQPVPAGRAEAARSEAAEIVDGAITAVTAEMTDALFGPMLFARYAGRLKVRVAGQRPWGVWSDGGPVESFAVYDPTASPVEPPAATMRWLYDQAAPPERVVAQVRAEAAQKVAGMNAVTRRRISDVVARGVRDGLPTTEIARRLRDEVGGMRLTRARLIAETETNMAMSRGADEKARELGAEQKEWVNSGDERVTAGCMENSAAGLIAIDAAFPSGHTMPPRFPGCRCAAGYHGGRVPAQPDSDRVPNFDRITPETLDAALAAIVGELPGVTYKSGLSLPPMHIGISLARKSLAQIRRAIEEGRTPGLLHPELVGQTPEGETST